MENEELDNELVVSDDVPETSEQNLEEVNISTSEDGEQVQETTEEVVIPSQEDIEKMIEERANKRTQEQIEQRLIRDRKNREKQQNKEMAKYRQLESIMKARLGVETLDEAINKSSEFYKVLLRGSTRASFIMPKTCARHKTANQGINSRRTQNGRF